MTRKIDKATTLSAGVLGLMLMAAVYAGQGKTAGMIGGVAVQPGEVTLPLEVIGPAGYTREVSFVLDDAGSVSTLFLQIHSPGYKYGRGGKASIQLNDGDWIDVSNKTATCYYPESHYECIGGAFATVRFTLAVSSAADGENVLRFRFNGTDGITSGYRVLAFNLLDAENEPLLAEELFSYEDVSTWEPPVNAPDAIAEGRRLWHEAVLTDSPLKANETIRATCADCHATSGMDLKYFNYSNHSIIERSVFHHLTREQGKQIASYIRSLDIEARGTPWDPPYQPGPGLDDAPVENWAAGAGLGAVLAYDSLSLPYMFPEGVIADAIDARSTLNMREIPVAIQLPDWNEWLPRVHPLDAWREVFEESQVNRYFYSDVLPLAEGGTPPRQALRILERWNKYFRQDRSRTLNNEYFGGYGSDGVVADYTLGYHQWQAVKTFEVMTAGSLQESAPALYGEHGEKRSWIGNSRSLFDVGPHISGPVQIGSYPHGSPLQNIFMTTAWYELQLIVNAGNRNGLSIRPMDWKYHYGHIADISKWSGVDEPLRYLKSYVKNLQEATNDRCRVGSGCGFYMRHLTPARLVVSQSETRQGGRSNRSSGKRGKGGDKNLFDSMSHELRRQVVEAVLRAHVVELLRHEPHEWERGTGRQALPETSYVPTMARSGKVFDMTSYADHYYRSIPVFKRIGISTSLIDSLSTWGDTMWPAGDWTVGPVR